MVGTDKKHMGRVQWRSADRLQPVSDIFETHPLRGVGVSLEGGGFVRFQFRLHGCKEDTKLSQLTKKINSAIIKS